VNTVLDTRPSPIAGQWYPSDSERLKKQVDIYIKAAELPDIDGEVVAVMAPHAGHQYSGPVAGYAFAALKNLKPDRVVVVSPLHGPSTDPLLTSAHKAYATPLGNIPVDHEALKLLNKNLLPELGYGLARVSDDREHSLEIELPFLQRALPESFWLVPVMVRDQSEKVARSLGNALKEMLIFNETSPIKSSILVASTDLSHFYSHEEANKLDKEMLAQVEAFDPSGVLQAEKAGRGFACGRGALAAVMWAAKGLGANRVKILNYATSGDVTGDYGNVVGYGAAVMSRAL